MPAAMTNAPHDPLAMALFGSNRQSADQAAPAARPTAYWAAGATALTAPATRTTTRR
jgi:hypothetical protein